MRPTRWDSCADSPVVWSDSVLPTQFVKILPPARTCCLLETWWCHPEGWHYTQGRRRPGYRHLWCWDAKTTCDGERRVPPGRVIAGAATASSSGFPGRSLLIRCITWFSLCWCFADNYRAISSRAYGDRASQFATTICLRYRCESRWSGGPRQTGDRDCTLMSHR